MSVCIQERNDGYQIFPHGVRAGCEGRRRWRTLARRRARSVEQSRGSSGVAAWREQACAAPGSKAWWCVDV
jgi:hypothetical protein